MMTWPVISGFEDEGGYKARNVNSFLLEKASREEHNPADSLDFSLMISVWDLCPPEL
jgi:hypothetical protein